MLFGVIVWFAQRKSNQNSPEELTMARKMNRFDLIDAVLRMRKAKEEMVKVAIVFDMDESFKNTVKAIKEQIGDMCVAINLIDDKIIEMDNNATK